MRLGGKVVLVTGGSSGIGKAIALELAAEGASVIVNYRKEAEKAESTVSMIRNSGGYAVSLQGDVASYRDCLNMVEGVVKQFGKLDILINNAGLARIVPFIDMGSEDWNALLDTNLKGVINMTHCAVKYMLSRKEGCILNISSIWGASGASCEAVYSATKGGINSFTKALAKELAPSNIRVNAIAPGVIRTEMNQCLRPEELEQLVDDIPMGRLGEGEDVGKAAVFLCSEASRYITGQILTVDGGFV